MAWKCRPDPRFNSLQRTGYLAGHSDGFHGFHFGAGYDDPPPTYRHGYEDGSADRSEEGATE
jgi:hypothetical protein